MLVLAPALLLFAPAATAQEQLPGFYGALRIGSQLGASVKLAAGDTADASTLPATIAYRWGKALEAAAGYFAHGLRLEAVFGYAAANVDSQRFDTVDLTTAGRTKLLTLGIASYYDLPLPGPLRPFIGGGVDGVNAIVHLSRLSRSTGAGSRIDDSRWGWRWHADLGLDYAFDEGASIELRGRYADAGPLDLAGSTPSGGGQVPHVFRVSQTATSLTVGIRQRF